MTKHVEPTNDTGDRPVLIENSLELKVSARKRLNFVDRVHNELSSIDHRWENRFSSKDFGIIGEAYACGRVSLICEFEKVSVVGIPDDVKDTASVEAKPHVFKTIFVHLINEAYASNFDNGDAWYDQIVLVDVVGLPDLPKTKVPSLVRLYDGEKLKSYQGECFHYSSVRWGCASRFGRHEGLTQRFPTFIGRESYARRISSLSHHHAGHDVVQGGAHIMERVANCQNEVSRYRLGNGFDKLFAGLSVSIVNNFAEIAIGIDPEMVVRLVNVVNGPIDL